MSAADWIAKQWCSWTHGGGDIKRDLQGRINWQCRKCGRWADPVSHETEARVIATDIRQATKEQREGGE